MVFDGVDLPRDMRNNVENSRRFVDSSAYSRRDDYERD